MAFGIYSETVAQDIYDNVIGGQRLLPEEDPLASSVVDNDWIFCRLTETIRPGSPLSAANTGKANRLKYTKFYPVSQSLEELESDTHEITIVNRDPNVFLAKGDYIWVREMAGEFAPVAGMRTELDAVLIEDLDKAYNITLLPATAQCKILHPSGAGLALCNWEETVTNRFLHIELKAKTFIGIKRRNGEWRLADTDCEVSELDTSGGNDDILGTYP